MKLKFLLLFALACCFAACTVEEEVLSENQDQELYSRSCEGCPTMTIEKRTENEEDCCQFYVQVENPTNCDFTLRINHPNYMQDRFVPIPSGETTRVRTRASCCAENDLIILDILSGKGEVCNTLFLSCCQDSCVQDCYVSFSPGQTRHNVEFVNSFSVQLCDNLNTTIDIEDSAVLFNNGSNCSTAEIEDLHNAIANPDINLISRHRAAENIENQLQQIRGCKDSGVYISVNTNNVLTYEISYDCETCPISSFNYNFSGLTPSDDCDEILGNVINSFPVTFETECGMCY